ncbi:hypothetical protein LB566_23475 [Mesorhizobium sp. CA13]|uniref:hypothetical protein n=1 Tax=Mesorhizobium sp. CA13 TaxID=2876643 RepID=UPI001CCE74E2|nr:hypothetical protein [Mesorhizobium sp. CA13]MBZ9856757.1 hypothetical protein [Mesorhizobium sp. CA13]
MSLLQPLDIVNAACAVIGEDPLEAFDGEAGGAAISIYEDVVGFNCGVYQFSFCRSLRQLSRVSDAVPLSGWTYVFDLPPERIGPPIYVTDDITSPDRRFNRYSLVDATVHASCEPLFAMIKIIPAPHLWSATFKSCTISAVAGRLAFSLAFDRATMESLTQVAYGSPIENFRGGQMRAAINEDAQATPPRKPDWSNNPFERAWKS